MGGPENFGGRFLTPEPPQDNGGWTPIIWAAEHKHIEVIRRLLTRGADVTLTDNVSFGEPPRGFGEPPQGFGVPWEWLGPSWGDLGPPGAVWRLPKPPKGVFALPKGGFEAPQLPLKVVSRPPNSPQSRFQVPQLPIKVVSRLPNSL